MSYTQQTGANSSTQLVQISNKVGDKYRFGYNGQEKDNEIAGVGNHNTAEFWEYDTRVGRRWNTDPVVKPWESSYACFANNPIWYSDVNGDDGTQTGSGNGYMTGDLNNVVVRCSRFNADKKDDKDESDDDKKSAGGSGGGGAGGAGAGANSKHSVGEDQLKKHAKQLKADGFGVEDNGGGGSGAQGGGSGQNAYQLADGFGQLMNAGGVVYGGSEMGLQAIRQGNGAQVIGKATGFGTQQAAQALKGTLGVVSKAGKILGVAGYGLQLISTGSKFVTGQDISKAEGVGFGISTVFLGAGVILSGTVAAPFVAAGALIYGAGQLGSYITTGKTLEENYYSK